MREPEFKDGKGSSSGDQTRLGAFTHPAGNSVCDHRDPGKGLSPQLKEGHDAHSCRTGSSILRTRRSGGSRHRTGKIQFRAKCHTYSRAPVDLSLKTGYSLSAAYTAAMLKGPSKVVGGKRCIEAICGE